MELVCPECGLTEFVDAVPTRLQTCPRCAKAGSDAYLDMAAPSLELRQPTPRRLAGRAVEESKRLRRSVRSGRAENPLRRPA